MDAHHRISILILTGSIMSLFGAILLAIKTVIGSYAFSLIPFSFLSFAAAALVERNEYKPAAFYALLAGAVTFPFGGFLTAWGGWTAYRYHPAHQVKKLIAVGVKPELANWIRKRLDKGYMEEYIRHVLEIHGYKKEVVNAAFKKIVEG